MEIIQEQNLIFANYNKNKSNGLLSSYVKPTLDENNKYKRVSPNSSTPTTATPNLKNSNSNINTVHEQQLSSSNPTSDYENDSSSSDTESISLKSHGDNDEKEIGLIANILLKISSKEIAIVSSTSSTSLVPNGDSPALQPIKLADSTNCVPFGALTLDSERNSLANSASSTPILNASTSSSPISAINLSSSTSTAPISISASSSSNALLNASTDSANDKKKKRQRTSPEQLAILEQIFETDKMPSQQIRHRLANQLGMSSRRVQIWFQNKRAKVKRGVFGDKDNADDTMDAEDNEDLEDDDNNLTIDDGSSIASSTSPSPLIQSTDNIVPSISPLMLSTNGSTVSTTSTTSTAVVAPAFSLSSSSSAINTTNAAAAAASLHIGNKKKMMSSSSSSVPTSSPSPNSSYSPLSHTKKHRTSRPTSPTQFNFTPVSFPTPSSSPSSTPTSPTNIKLNSSSTGIPTNTNNNNTTTFKQYNFSFDHHTTTASNSPPPPSSTNEYKEIRFHNVTLK